MDKEVHSRQRRVSTDIKGQRNTPVLMAYSGYLEPTE